MGGKSSEDLMDRVKQTGVNCSDFEAAMKWKPDHILAFPGQDGYHQKLKNSKGTLDERVNSVNLNDPTAQEPWQLPQLEAFKKAVYTAADYLFDGKKVLFLCVGGKNRSNAAAIAAVKLACSKLEIGDLSSELLLPVDENLFPVIRAVVMKTPLDQIDPCPPPCRRTRHTFPPT